MLTYEQQNKQKVTKLLEECFRRAYKDERIKLDYDADEDVVELDTPYGHTTINTRQDSVAAFISDVVKGVRHYCE